MVSKSQKVRLGIFIIVSSFLFLVLLFIIGTAQLFQEKDIYYIAYEDVSVSGLEIGSPVKYLGINVGTIKDIRIDLEDINRIVVTVALTPGTPVKRDARAEISAIGITGLKMIEIRGGSNTAALLDKEQYILAGSSLTEEITGKAEILLNNLNRFTQAENLDKITVLVETATSTFQSIDETIIENRGDLHNSIQNISLVTARLDTIAWLAQNSSERINQITKSDTLGKILANIQDVTLSLKEANLIGLIHQLGEVVAQTSRVLDAMDHDLESGSKDFLNSLQKLKSVLDYLDEAARMINEDPSILIRGTTLEDIPDEDLDG